MTQGKPEDRKPATPEKAGNEALENGWKPGEELNCPCFGARPRRERPKRDPWLDT